MLYPSFNELVALRAHILRSKVIPRHASLCKTIGDYYSPFRGQGLEFEETRVYVYGDDVRNIDWRVTARTGVPHVKLFKEERERSVIICVDVNTTMHFGTRGTFKSVQAARAASIIGWYANANHDRLGTCLFGNIKEGMRFFAPTRSRKSLWAMLKLLSNVRETYEHQVTLTDTIQHINKAAPTHALVYIISDFLDITNGLEQQIYNLKRRCDVICIAVNDIADQFIPALGTIICTDYQGITYRINTDDVTSKNRYQLQWQTNRAALHCITKRANIPVIQLMTNKDVQKDLFYNMLKISRHKSKL